MATRQQFIFTNKTVGITTILFKNDNPFENVEKIVFFKETGLRGNWLKKEFRYSFDGSTWSSWRTFTQSNLTGLSFNNQPNFYIEILYTRKNYNSAGIDDLYLFYDSTTASPVDPSTAKIDADTLQGQPGSYYLDRENFTGPYTGLNVENVVDGSSAGVYFGRTDTSLGTTFYFKRIEGGDNVEIVDSSSGIITINVDASGVGGASYENDDPVSETVGGITDGDSFFVGGKTFAETMEAIFYPLAFPALTPPSSGFSFSPSLDSLQVIGDDISLPFRSTFSRGSINPQYDADSAFRSGPGNTVYISGPDVNISTGSYPASPYTYTLGSYEVSIGIQTWTNNWDYDEGVQPFDSKGDPYDSSLAAGSTSTDSLSFEGVYPIYATTSDITTLTQQPLVSMINGDNIEFQMVAEPPFGTDRQKFDLPDAWISSRPLVSIQFYSDLEQAWKYEGGSEASSLTFWATSTPTPYIINGNSILYTRYTYNSVDKQGTVLYRLNFS